MARSKRSGIKQPGFLTRMRASLNRGNSWLTYDLRNLLPGETIDQDALDELEARLLTADMGVDATSRIMERVQSLYDGGRITSRKQLASALKEPMSDVLKPVEQPLNVERESGPFVMLVTGVNGVGKTTTIGKLARKYVDAGYSVMLAAGDTFRAAAVEQLQEWGEQNGVSVVAQGTGADAASVAFDAYARAAAQGVDVLIADTAGRLHTQDNLMGELAKVKRVLGKQDTTAPHETMLVVDATTGGNALAQARSFHDSIGLTGLTVTKLDGTAAGGVIFAIAETMALPIRFIGIGETTEDLDVFDAERFVDAVFSDRSA
ncbi:signal recognition particle-docking protein FtsY [Salinisphaera orenii]|uniref:signal recognition particle-docking protein FtsY n=1 Tax=Salinisphaera orenii TaxID=856731 RepID=UPI001E37EA87